MTARDAELAALLTENAEDLYENAPCGYLSTLLDGRIVKINATLLRWLGRTRAEVVDRLRFSDLLTVGGKVYHETHFAPLLRLQGQVGGIAMEMVAADGTRLPVLVTAVVRTAADGRPLLVRTTVFDARDRRAYERELLRAKQEADRERDLTKKLATTLQRTLLPPALADVPGMRVAAHYHPASRHDVGGDFYDLFPLTDDRWAFFLGDVCGKGPEAAVVTSLTRYTLRAAAIRDPDPEHVLRHLNQVLTHNDDSRFCTVIFGVLTPRSGDVVLASGGHPPALLVRADGAARYQHTRRGQLMGVLPEARVTTTSLRLAAGDTLLLYTDGLTESRVDDTGTRYGEDQLREFAAQRAPTDARELVDAIADLLATFGDGLEDDTTMLALSVPATN